MELIASLPTSDAEPQFVYYEEINERRFSNCHVTINHNRMMLCVQQEECP